MFIVIRTRNSPSEGLASWKSESSSMKSVVCCIMADGNVTLVCFVLMAIGLPCH